MPLLRQKDRGGRMITLTIPMQDYECRKNAVIAFAMSGYSVREVTESEQFELGSKFFIEVQIPTETKIEVKE